MAAPIDAGSIYSDVRIRLDRLNADLKAVSTGFDKLGKGIQKGSDETTKKQTDNFKSVGLAGVAAIGAITIAFKKSISVFADTEQSLANVKAVSNATAAEFNELEKAAAAAGTTTRFTAGQAADALFYLSSAGLSATESVKALDGVLLLAGATGSDLAFAAQAITSTLSQFGLEASKAADVSNIFAAANSNSQATLDKLASSLRQAGPVAAGLGIGLEEVVGSLQALFNAGFKGEQAGTALRNALADLANQSSPTIEKLQALGVSFESVNPEAVGLTGAIGALAEAGLSTGEVIEAFGKEVGPQLLTLIKVGQKGLEEYTEAVTGTNEAARQYAVQNDTLSGSLDSLASAAEGTSNSFIKELTPVLRGFIDLATFILRILNKIPAAFKGFGIGAGVAAGGLIALSKALALIGVTLSTGPLAIVAAIGALTVGLTALVSQAKAAKAIRLSEEFGDLARELGYAGQAVDDFTKKAGNISGDFARFDTVNETLDETISRLDRMSEVFGLSRDEIIAIGLSSKDVSEQYKEQLRLVQDQVFEQQALEEFTNKASIAQQQILDRKREQARIEAVASAKKALSDKEEKERADRLIKIKERLITLDELSLRGALTEKDALEEKKALREEEISLLLEQALKSGEITDQVVADIATQQAAVDRYAERLELLDSQSDENLQKEKDRMDEQAEAFEELAKNREERHKEMLLKIGEDAEEAAKIQAKLDEEEKQRKLDLYNNITDAATNFFGALVALSDSSTATEIANINSALDAQLSAIDVQTQAVLESLGIQEETKLESLQTQLDAAIAEGDAETAQELQNEIARTEIIQAAEDEKIALKEEADRKTRKLQREQAIRHRALATFQAGIDTAGAIIGFLNNPGGIPGIVLSIAAGITGIAQIAAINTAPLPALQTGGIVLPQSGGTAAILAENGSPELALNSGTEGESLLNMFAQKVAAAQGAGKGGSFTLILERDGRKEAEAVVEYINNGVVRLAI